MNTLSIKERQYLAQAGRCWLCQVWTLPDNLTFDHVQPRHGVTSRRRGRADCVLMHLSCNRAKANKTPGSVKFRRWLRHAINGNIHWRRPGQTRWNEFRGMDSRGCA